MRGGGSALVPAQSSAVALQGVHPLSLPKTQSSVSSRGPPRGKRDGGFGRRGQEKSIESSSTRFLVGTGPSADQVLKILTPSRSNPLRSVVGRFRPVDTEGFLYPR
jgi:hypothetical protein